MKKNKIIIIVLLLVLLLVPAVLLFIYTFQNIYGKEGCSGSLPPQFQEKCETDIAGIKLRNPILNCATSMTKKGGSGKCDYFWVFQE